MLTKTWWLPLVFAAFTVPTLSSPMPLDGPASDASGTDALGKILLHHDGPKAAAGDELTHVLAAVVGQDLQAEIVCQVDSEGLELRL